MEKQLWNKRFKTWDEQKERETYDLEFYDKHRRYYQKGLMLLQHWFDTNIPGYISVADVGCGQGDFLVPFLAGGKQVLGIDFSVGAKTNLAIPSANYVDHDLTKPLLGRTDKYDVVISLEVYEHIPHMYEDAYLGNIVSLCHDKSTLIISCAQHDQKGRHHYNCRGLESVMPDIEARGFKYDDALTQSFREIKKLAMFYRANTAVFHRTTT